MTDLLNSSHDLLNRRIEEAADKAWTTENFPYVNMYGETILYTPSSWAQMTSRKGAGLHMFKEGAKWALEYIKECEARKRAIDYVCDKRGW